MEKLSEDFLREAQYFYEKNPADGDVCDIEEGTDTWKLYDKDKAYSKETWADRTPKGIKETSSTDGCWKGGFIHENAIVTAETHHCPDPLAVIKMEEIVTVRGSGEH